VLRFINLTGQITEGDFEFAWYDTVTDRFLEFCGSQTWDSWDDFVSDYSPDETFPLSRFESLFQPTLKEKDARIPITWRYSRFNVDSGKWEESNNSTGPWREVSGEWKDADPTPDPD